MLWTMNTHITRLSTDLKCKMITKNNNQKTTPIIYNIDDVGILDIFSRYSWTVYDLQHLTETPKFFIFVAVYGNNGFS